MIKKGKNSAIKKWWILAVFGVVFPLLFFCQIIKANSPDNPAPPDPGANIGIVMQGVDLSNPNLPKVIWTTYGNTPVYYWVQVSEYQDFSVKAVDTGQQVGNPQSYTISSGLVAGRSYYVRVSVRDSYSWTPWVCPVSGAFFYNPNNAPTVSNLRTAGDFCVSATTIIFSWDYSDPDGDPQAAYQVQVAENPSFSPLVIDSGKVFSGSYSYSTNALSLNKTYYWRLMVWDSRGFSSSWITGQSFSTPSHAYPTADFTWFPNLPAIGQEILFMDKSRAYGGAIIVSWNWTIPDANYVAPSASASQNPVAKFTSEGDKIVRLQATDSDGFSCSVQKTVRASLPLPCWKEINPR